MNYGASLAINLEIILVIGFYVKRDLKIILLANLLYTEIVKYYPNSIKRYYSGN